MATSAAANLEDVPSVDLMTELLRRMKCSSKPDKRLILVGNFHLFSSFIHFIYMNNSTVLHEFWFRKSSILLRSDVILSINWFTLLGFCFCWIYWRSDLIMLHVFEFINFELFRA
ncbi:putative adenylate kinase [Helianthus annuus]|nr:putative adenylate kinase [Helianthus annuus]